jgi:hypothetical protein
MAVCSTQPSESARRGAAWHGLVQCKACTLLVGWAMLGLGHAAQQRTRGRQPLRGECTVAGAVAGFQVRVLLDVRGGGVDRHARRHAEDDTLCTLPSLDDIIPPKHTRARAQTHAHTLPLPPGPSRPQTEAPT